MNKQELGALNLQWINDDRLTKARFVQFKEPGDFVVGGIVHHHPTFGAQTFDREDCGLLVLQTAPNTWVRVGLDKGNLATAVNNAIIMRNRTWTDHTDGIVMIVAFVEVHEKGYKVYRARVARALTTRPLRHPGGNPSE